MNPFRFVHTADLHLGKPFGRYGEADRLRVARADALGRVAALAQEHGAPHVLVAGDLFDTPNPAAATWRKAAAIMAEAPDVQWWLLPGNHDNLAEGRRTWEEIDGHGHANIHVLTATESIQMHDDAVLLPAPQTHRRPPSDPTAWMDGCQTPAGCYRIGLAHGSVQSFTEGELPDDIIAPDRDRRARLDYLALGDWHGDVPISPRVGYCGAPERTDFRHDGRGSCRIVEIEAPGAVPRVSTVEVGRFDWRTVKLDLLPGDDPEARLTEQLPDGPRRQMLVRIVAEGRLTLGDASALTMIEDRLGPDFCHFKIRMDGLQTEIESADLDAIAPSGALRQAGDALARRAGDGTLSERERKVAAAALRRLHTIVVGGPR